MRKMRTIPHIAGSSHCPQGAVFPPAVEGRCFVPSTTPIVNPETSRGPERRAPCAFPFEGRPFARKRSHERVATMEPLIFAHSLTVSLSARSANAPEIPHRTWDSESQLSSGSEMMTHFFIAFIYLSHLSQRSVAMALVAARRVAGRPLWLCPLEVIGYSSLTREFRCSTARLQGR